MFKSIVFDVDSTLVTIEGLDEIARRKSVLTEVASITTAGMRGEISFQESLTMRLNIVNPSRDGVVWLGEQYLLHLTPGGKEVISFLRSHDSGVYLVSGAYSLAIEKLALHLGVDQKNVFGIDLEFDNEGEYVSTDPSQLLLQDNGKRKLIEQLDLERPLAMIGDGSTDLETKSYADLFIGFGGVTEREVVKRKADKYIYDLKDVIELVKG